MQEEQLLRSKSKLNFEKKIKCRLPMKHASGSVIKSAFCLCRVRRKDQSREINLRIFHMYVVLKDRKVVRSASMKV